ncbi:tRNA (adenosine(37)-N6)-threonylcarbamoyltransferase complex dimerization subunit type 1 TsaB, partial [Georgenia sp. 10Sc9-8]|nr:tRNA (adenosine(37)-N6)-threonylcarbamoyltransferase complex dimerization subunit type 1 TsaB [Georgenia halotolerans]
DVERLTGPHVQPPADVAARIDLTGPVAVVGPGAPLLPGHVATAVAPPLDPAVLARILRARLAREAAGSAVELGTEPMYLRRPDVQPPSAPKRARG